MKSSTNIHSLVLISMSLTCIATEKNNIAYWQNNGVIFRSPHAVVLHDDIDVGYGTIIEAGVHILNGSKIGKNCHLKAYCIIDASIVEDGSTIGYHSVLDGSQVAKGSIIHSHTSIEGSTVGEKAIVGPYARLRKKSSVAQEAEIGNFVELSASSVGPKSKAKHLTYLGCTVVEEKVNIGAGTITCNYDGYARHKTIIEKGCFIGSNSIIVAPLRVGTNSIIGAGSVCTKDIPENSLAIGRAYQVNKSNYASKIKDKFRIRAQAANN